METIHALTHPIETIQHTILTLGHVCACLDHYILKDALLHTMRNSPLIAGPDALGHLPDDITQQLSLPSISEAEPSELALLLEQTLEERKHWGTLWDLCQDTYGRFTQWREETPPENKAEQVTAFVFKGLLNIGLNKCMGAGIQKSGRSASQAIRAANTPNLAMAAEGVAIAQGAARAETIADALATAGIVTGRTAQAAGPAQMFSQRGTDQQPQGGAEKPPQSDMQDELVSKPIKDHKKNEKHPATPVGGKGKQFAVPDGTNQETQINGRIYCGHALDQMQERGIYPAMIEAAIENGLQEFQRNGRIAYHDTVSHLTVVVETTGKVVTAFFKTR